MHPLYGRQIFAVDGEVYYWEDVILFALATGRWDALERAARQGLQAAAQWERSGQPLPQDEIDAAAQEFRYDRDLITARETEAWLEARGLATRDWMAHIRRQVLRRLPPPAGLPAAPASDAREVEDILRIDLLCSGEGGPLAQRLAERAAAAHATRVGGLPESPPGAPPPAPSRLTDKMLAERLPSLPLQRAHERIRLLTEVDRGFDRFQVMALTDSAIDKEVGRRRLEWIRIDCRALGFDSEARAREAALCVREDGLSIDTVSADAHVDTHDSRFFLEEMDAELRPAFMAARPVDLVGPVLFEGSHTLFRILDKVLPSGSDPEVRRRAEASVLARAVADEVQRRVRWLGPT
jgi:hypothetical protein